MNNALGSFQSTKTTHTRQDSLSSWSCYIVKVAGMVNMYKHMWNTSMRPCFLKTHVKRTKRQAFILQLYSLSKASYPSSHIILNCKLELIMQLTRSFITKISHMLTEKMTDTKYRLSMYLSMNF